MEPNKHNKRKKTKKENGATKKEGNVGTKKKPVPETFYKMQGGKITIRKPRANSDYIAYTVNESSVSSAKVKNFLKYIITDVKELNFLKNDVGFLLNELYGEDHSTDRSVPVEDGRIFFTWVYLPYFSNSGTNTLPRDIRTNIIPFDLAFIRKKITNVECERLIMHRLKTEVNVLIHVRHPFEKPTVPILAHATPHAGGN